MAHRNLTHPLRLLSLVALFAVLALPAATATPEDEPLTERRARVANMIGAGALETSNGGLRIVLAFDDNNPGPAQLMLWVDKRLFDRTNTGDLFIVRYRADGSMVDFIGPIRE